MRVQKEAPCARHSLSGLWNGMHTEAHDAPVIGSGGGHVECQSLAGDVIGRSWNHVLAVHGPMSGCQLCLSLLHCVSLWASTEYHLDPSSSHGLNTCVEVCEALLDALSASKWSSGSPPSSKKALAFVHVPSPLKGSNQWCPTQAASEGLFTIGERLVMTLHLDDTNSSDCLRRHATSIGPGLLASPTAKGLHRHALNP